MKTKIFLLVVISLFAISCKKKTNVTIQAKHLITGEGSGYANMPFQVVAKRDVSFNETKSELAYSGTLDENGFATFELKMKNSWSYILDVKVPDNICYGKVSQYYLEHKDKNNTIEFDYLPCGYVNIHRDNVNCEGETDVLRQVYYYTQNPDIYIYMGGGAKGPATNWVWTDNHPASGCYSYFGNKSISVPEGHYTIEWQVTRPSGITTGIDTFTVYENDTATYLIQY